jgi:hypothetical protein
VKLKVVAQATPTYAMSVFLVPKEIFKGSRMQSLNVGGVIM